MKVQTFELKNYDLKLLFTLERHEPPRSKPNVPDEGSHGTWSYWVYSRVFRDAYY